MSTDRLLLAVVLLVAALVALAGAPLPYPATVGELALQGGAWSRPGATQDTQAVGGERNGLFDRGVTPEPAGVNPARRQPGAWQLPLLSASVGARSSVIEQPVCREERTGTERSGEASEHGMANGMASGSPGPASGGSGMLAHPIRAEEAVDGNVGLAVDAVPGAPGGLELARHPARAGVATYVHDFLSGQITASGERYNPWDPSYAASNDYPMGTQLVIEYRREITVTVSDRGRLGPGHLDLSRAGIVALVGSVEPGVLDVQVQEVR